MKNKLRILALSLRLGMGLEKINKELFGIDGRKQAIVRNLNGGFGGNKTRRSARMPRFPFSSGERLALAQLHGKAKKLFIKELKIKYADCDRRRLE